MTLPGLRRLGLRGKLTLVFLCVMSVVLSAIGTFLFFRTKQNLDDGIRDSLRLRAGEVARAVRGGGTATAGRRVRAISPDERFAQVLGQDGRVLASRPVGAPALLSAAEAAATSAPRFFERGEERRLLAVPVRAGPRRELAVVAASLAEREQALEGLGRALLLGGPLALLFASALAYAIATAALRPVDLMRRRAAEITTADPAARLPVPASHDEIHRLAVTLNEMLARLAGVAAQERSFIANASHELRTPISTLHAELELALRHAGTLEDFRAATRHALADTDELARLADDLLTLAGADGGAGLHREQLELRPLLEEAAQELRALLGPEGRRVRVVEPSGPVQACADAQRLRRAVRNMAANAALHGSGDVELGLARDGDRVVVTVTDAGAALPPDILDAAFERFGRGRGARGRPGAGLGLPIVRGIARAHGGEARLENVPGGVRCLVELPVRGPD